MKRRPSEISYKPCPPEEFSGRFEEREKLLDVLSTAEDRGQAVLISGARGSGKSSFLDWAEYEIQEREAGLQSPAIKRAFLETPGMVFVTYRDLLTQLKGHQKFGWFRKTLNNDKVSKSIDSVLGALETVSSLAGPAKAGIDVAAALARGALPAPAVEYSQLLSPFLVVLRNLSEALDGKRFLAVLCDDAQWSSEPDFALLKDLFRNLPPGIVFIITFRLETESMAMYANLRQELDRFGHNEINLSGMAAEEVRDFALRRYAFSVDEATAEFLHRNIGDPLCLVNCFNLMHRRQMEPNLASVQEILLEAVDPIRCIYSGLEEKWRSRVDTLCILRPPMPLSLIAAMLETEAHELARLQDELNQSVVFRRLEKEIYDFAHPSLREYRRNELPESISVMLHAKAARCMETMQNGR